MLLIYARMHDPQIRAAIAKIFAAKRFVDVIVTSTLITVAVFADHVLQLVYSRKFLRPDRQKLTVPRRKS